MLNKTVNVLQHGPTLCHTLIPESVHAALYSAMVCGTSLPAGWEKQVFLDSGLIHIMVVSGAHLLFLESLLSRAPRRVRLPCLFFYCWFTGFGAPVVRAFAHRVVQTFLQPKGWSGIQIEAAAVTLTLALWPSWLLSRSLQMSWMCALALSLPRILRPAALDQAVKAYALLFVFAGAPLLSIAWNTLLAPLVGVILFPLCLSVLLFPWLSGPVDLVWDLFLWILRWGPKGNPQQWFISSKDLFWLPPLLHGYLLVKEIRWRRKRAFSC